MKKNKSLIFILVTVTFFSLISSNVIFAESAPRNQYIQSLEKQVNLLSTKVANLKKQQEKANKIDKTNKINEISNENKIPAIVTTPIIGTPAYDGSDLLINLSYVNEDLEILKLNQEIDKHYATTATNTANNTPPTTATTPNNIKFPIKFPDYPILMISGTLEGWLTTSSKLNDVNNDGFDNSSNSDTELSVAEIEGVARINPWISGLIKFEYQNESSSSTANSANSANSSNSASSSIIVLKRGYIVVGNLERSPIYASIGKMYVPFGSYNNYMTSDPLTLNLARTEGHPIVLGFKAKNGVYGSIYAFKSVTHKGKSNSSNNAINAWGTNLAYEHISDNQETALNIGASYISNIADAVNTLDNGYGKNGGFSGFSSNPQLQKPVQAVSFYTSFYYEPFILIAEYITALEKFDRRDLSFNNHGAKIRALDLEGVYTFSIIGKKPSFISAGYGRTWEALSLNLPQQSYFISVGTSLFKNTVQSIEYRYDINYDRTDVASGAGKPLLVGAKQRYQIVASFKIYF